ncbi:uncharacterized protein B0P05DRAFT_166991 [Gilbertella persicaria]|uniref:uncharacterized protein n=1 Tax=Gilbertella persicaria TaxID=101096 RepID=UPI00221EF1BB|nr:uncharacterized protein B0P05DRAFT_166991 [Gilbertella persicaria]KAI8094894.1 hypothetical protein B0P05DRAFT_166991 [Gilbertella persicaria]
MTGEVARMASKGKLYGDRLKSVLATKCHLNNLLSTISCLDANTAKSISVPVVQIMGLNAHVFVLKLVNRGIYTLQEVCSFRFPVATNSLKDNLKEIVDGLSLIESLVLEIRQVYQTYQLPHDDHMARIVNEERRLKKFSPSKWTTDVIWNPDVAEEKDGEEEEEENEDDEDEDGEDDEEDDE